VSAVSYFPYGYALVSRTAFFPLGRTSISLASPKMQQNRYCSPTSDRSAGGDPDEFHSLVHFSALREWDRARLERPDSTPFPALRYPRRQR
jgi:hypothetical protein